MAAGASAALAGGVLCSDRRLVAGSVVTIAAQGSYVLGGLAAAGGSALALKSLVHLPGFAAGRLRVLGRVASGRGARSWVRTTRSDKSLPDRC
jgi:hypothetical protein